MYVVRSNLLLNMLGVVSLEEIPTWRGETGTGKGETQQRANGSIDRSLYTHIVSTGLVEIPSQKRKHFFSLPSGQSMPEPTTF